MSWKLHAIDFMLMKTDKTFNSQIKSNILRIIEIKIHQRHEKIELLFEYRFGMLIFMSSMNVRKT